ncbi:LysR family transcriptional regulator [Nocardioides sp. L-11A]|uniref:LysR family transcriptional regulator n=1 Tax=Nocardioides sp. L-11A TaxID=3043848 RepID=UPI00249A3A17|nr:LysR family transcriptional regulator [Nocardioides sp. L-11A]
MTPNFSLRQLEFFVEAATLGSFSAAARKCHTSQTAVSLAVTDLERHLKVQLLTRRKAKGVVLTDAGARLVAQARELLEAAEHLQESALADRTQVNGRVTFGCLPTVSPYVVPHLIDTTRAEYPNLELTLLEAPTDGLIAALTDGTCDVAMFYSTPDINGLELTSLGAFKPYVLLAADHRLARRPDIRLAELADEELITPMNSTQFYDSEDVVRAAGVEVRIGVRSGNLDIVRALVARNLGFAILVQPWKARESHEGRPLVALPISDDIPTARLVLATLSGIRPTLRTEVVKATCARLYDDGEPGGDTPRG